MALKAAKRYKGYANTPTKFNAQKLLLNLLDSFDIVDIEFSTWAILKKISFN